jgi:hypothetical protein
MSTTNPTRPDRPEAARRLIVRAAILLGTVRRSDHIAQSMGEAAGLWRGEEFARSGAVLGVFPELAASALAREAVVQEKIYVAAESIVDRGTPTAWEKLATATALACGVSPAEADRFIRGALPLSDAFRAMAYSQLHGELRTIDAQRDTARNEGRLAAAKELDRQFVEALHALEAV